MDKIYFIMEFDRNAMANSSIQSSEFCIHQGPLSPECEKLALEELRETPERKAEAILKLRELLHENKDLYFRDDDDFLVTFLRPCKFYPESAIALMRRIAEFKQTNAEVLDGLMPVDEKAAFLDNDVVNILKKRDHKGRRVLLVNCGGSWDPKKVNSDQLFRLFYLIHEAAMLEPETQVRGVVVIMDFEKMGMTQVGGLGITFSRRLMTFIQDAMPLRLKEVHFVKEPWVFSVVWNLFKPLIKQKLKSRMFFHKNNMSSLHKHLAPSHLPSNFGGELPAIDYTGAQWYDVVQNHLDHIEAWNSYGFVKKESEK